jgi:hypothetical protein
MKAFRFAFGLFVTCLFVALSALPSFAFGGFQSNADSERAGYQGIPVRNDSNRSAFQQVRSADTQRYPTLPRRQNETDLNSASVAGRQSGNQNDQDGGGYRGIPRSGNSNHDDVQRNQNPDPQMVDRPGYQGIPQSAATSAIETQLATQRSSAFVNPK